MARSVQGRWPARTPADEPSRAGRTWQVADEGSVATFSWHAHSAGLVEQEQEVNSRWIHNQDVISIPDTCPRLLNDIWVVAQALCVAPL